MPETIKEVIKGKFWIVEGTYGKIGTIRSTNNGFEFLCPAQSTHSRFEHKAKAAKKGARRRAAHLRTPAFAGGKGA